jgi:hypothetical protein
LYPPSNTARTRAPTSFAAAVGRACVHSPGAGDNRPMPGEPRTVFLGLGKFARGRIYALEALPSELADGARACGSTGSPTPSWPRGPSPQSCTTWDRMPPRKRRSSTTHSTSPNAWSRRPRPVGSTLGTSGDGPADRSRPRQARTRATSRCLSGPADPPQPSGPVRRGIGGGWRRR